MRLSSDDQCNLGMFSVGDYLGPVTRLYCLHSLVEMGAVLMVACAAVSAMCFSLVAR